MFLPKKQSNVLKMVTNYNGQNLNKLTNSQIRRIIYLKLPFNRRICCNVTINALLEKGYAYFNWQTNIRLIGKRHELYMEKNGTQPEYLNGKINHTNTFDLSRNVQ